MPLQTVPDGAALREPLEPDRGGLRAGHGDLAAVGRAPGQAAPHEVPRDQPGQVILPSG